MSDGDSLEQRLLKDFLIESFEDMERFEEELLNLENGDYTSETLNGIFRIVHTLKGTGGCLGLKQLEHVAHIGENVLGLMREDKLAVTEPVVSALIKCSDALKEILQHLESEGVESDEEYAEVIAELNEVQKAKTDGAAESTEEKPEEAKDESTVVEGEDFVLFDDEPVAPAASADTATDEEGGFELFLPLPNKQEVEPTPPPAATPAKAKPTADKAAKEKSSAGGKNLADSVVKVSIEQLDKIMNLVGELVLSRNQIVQRSGITQDRILTSAAQRLDVITTELQERVMKTRMEPIDNIWAKLPRIVRDVSKLVDKKVDLAMSGGSTELDRNIIKAIKDPLTHIIRNSIDHGIEPPDERISLEKPEAGSLYLTAYHEGGQVNIEIIDDGRGLNTEKIKEKAIKNGLISEEQAAAMGDQEAANLIFAPGFSTAEAVTNISGRGVGMDVVKTNIEKIGGSIEIDSNFGQGTTIILKIPLTLAIIPVLIVKGNGHRFAIPQASLQEMVRLEEKQAEEEIEYVNGVPLLRLRDQLLPLVYLNDVLDLKEEEEDKGPQTRANKVRQASTNVVVLRIDGNLFGLVVNSVEDTEEIVVKPLGKHFSDIGLYSGATIMGDGLVVLILDVMGIAEKGRVGQNKVSDSSSEDDKEEQLINQDAQSFVLFNVAGGEQMAVPLQQIERLEEFASENVEHSGDSEVIQYRDSIIPLVRLDRHLFANRMHSLDPDQPKQRRLKVLIYTTDGQSVGLIVDKINDIVEESISIEQNTRRMGILGSAVIQGKVVDLINIEEIMGNTNIHVSTEALMSN